MVATQNYETLNYIIFTRLIGQGHEESAASAAGPGEVNSRGVERVHERAQGRLLGKPIQFHEEGIGRLPERPRRLRKVRRSVRGWACRQGGPSRAPSRSIKFAAKTLVHAAQLRAAGRNAGRWGRLALA